eukprot:gene23857-biopygen19368
MDPRKGRFCVHGLGLTGGWLKDRSPVSPNLQLLAGYRGWKDLRLSKNTNLVGWRGGPRPPPPQLGPPAKNWGRVFTTNGSVYYMCPELRFGWFSNNPGSSGVALSVFPLEGGLVLKRRPQAAEDAPGSCIWCRKSGWRHIIRPVCGNRQALFADYSADRRSTCTRGNGVTVPTKQQHEVCGFERTVHRVTYSGATEGRSDDAVIILGGSFRGSRGGGGGVQQAHSSTGTKCTGLIQCAGCAKCKVAHRSNPVHRSSSVQGRSEGGPPPHPKPLEPLKPFGIFIEIRECHCPGLRTWIIFSWQCAAFTSGSILTGRSFFWFLEAGLGWPVDTSALQHRASLTAKGACAFPAAKGLRVANSGRRLHVSGNEGGLAPSLFEENPK